MTQVLTAVATILALGTVAACGGSDNNTTREAEMESVAAEHGIDADVRLDASGEVDQVVINAGGGQVGKNLDLPTGFPDDIDLPEDWEIISASAPLPGSHSLQMLSVSTADEIIADLRSRMTASGWSEVAFSTPAPTMTQINFEKADQMANFNVIQNGDTRAIQILAMPKP